MGKVSCSSFNSTLMKQLGHAIAGCNETGLMLVLNLLVKLFETCYLWKVLLKH